MQRNVPGCQIKHKLEWHTLWFLRPKALLFLLLNEFVLIFLNVLWKFGNVFIYIFSPVNIHNVNYNFFKLLNHLNQYYHHPHYRFFSFFLKRIVRILGIADLSSSAKYSFTSTTSKLLFFAVRIKSDT